MINSRHWFSPVQPQHGGGQSAARGDDSAVARSGQQCAVVVLDCFVKPAAGECGRQAKGGRRRPLRSLQTALGGQFEGGGVGAGDGLPDAEAGERTEPLAEGLPQLGVVAEGEPNDHRQRGEQLFIAK